MLSSEYLAPTSSKRRSRQQCQTGVGPNGCIQLRGNVFIVPSGVNAGAAQLPAAAGSASTGPPARALRTRSRSTFLASLPRWAREICDVSSLTTTTSASVSSDRPERGAVAGTQAAVGHGELRQRQDHAGGDDGVALDEDGAVVERAVGREQADDQVGADAGLDARPGFGVLIESDVALDGDDGADPWRGSAAPRPPPAPRRPRVPPCG
jgi:hypothetical protein